MSMPCDSKLFSPSANANVMKSHRSLWPRVLSAYVSPHMIAAVVSTHQLILSRNYIREPAAEFLGVMILVMFGNGAACQAQLSGNKNVASTAYGVSESIMSTHHLHLCHHNWKRTSAAGHS